MIPHTEATRPEPGAHISEDSLAINVQGLSKHFGARKAVDGLTFSVPCGVIAGFIGPNGAGKTTTIRMLLGLIRPTEGTATVLGKGISHPHMYLPHIGGLIESPAFYPTLSGRKNLEVLAHLGGHPLQRVKQVLEFVGLNDRGKDLVRSYSLGMKQRLGVAMALLPDPELLILDEPANGLDPLGIIQLRDQLRTLRDQGKTILLSSHLLGELEQVSDWLVMLNQGKAVFSGPARTLVEHRGALIVEAADTIQRDLVARIATEEGYSVTQQDGSLHITCPVDWATELKKRAKETGA